MSDEHDDESRSTRIACLRRSDREELRVSLETFRGNNYVSLRIWAMCSDGELRPVGRKGVSVRVREIDEVIAALDVCRDILDEEGSL